MKCIFSSIDNDCLEQTSDGISATAHDVAILLHSGPVCSLLRIPMTLLLPDDVLPQPSDRAGIRGRISSPAFATKTERRTNQAIGAADRGRSRAATGAVQDCERLYLFNSKCSFL